MDYMDSTTRDILLMILILAAGIAFAFSTVPGKINYSTFYATNVTLNFLSLNEVSLYTPDRQFEISIGFVYEIIFAIILLKLPVSLIGGTWFLRLAYQFLFGEGSKVEAFGLPLSMRILFSLIFVIAFFYSIYKQYYWLDQIIEKRKFFKESLDETKLI